VTRRIPRENAGNPDRNMRTMRRMPLDDAA
jgi:hypothetical protein